MDGYPVGAVAALSGISVRTLHHYDEIGLLVPRERTAGGYRLYSEAELARLRRIIFYRELGFGLDEIAEILADPGSGTDDHLRRQHRLLRERIARQQDLLASLEKEMEARAMGISLTPQEQFEVFGTDQVGGEWAAEAKQRWGESGAYREAYRESQRRGAAYTKQDWVAMKAEADAGLREFAAAMRDGSPAHGDRAMGLAEVHRQYLRCWFYDCGYELHRGLAQMYIADPRFTATYEDVAPGLAQYVHDAICANADRGGG